MIKLNDIIDVHVEKTAYGGDGLARVGEEKFVIFVKNALLGDDLKVKIIQKNKSFARAEIIEIINSPNRTKPFCALYNACGSCDNQLCSYEFGVEQKGAIIKDIFSSVIDENKIFPVIKSPETKEYRKKIQYPVRQTKNSKRILMGYYKENSHELINIKFCPLVPSLMNEIAQFIRENAPFDCYFEKTNKGFLKHVLARFNTQNELLLTFVVNSDKIERKVNLFFKDLKEKFSEIKGIFVNFNLEKTNKILGKTTLKILGDDYIIENLEDKKFKIGAVSFFQVNPKAAVELFKIVRENIEPDSTLLDAYGGVGAIGIFASQKASKITLVEEDENALKLARDNFELNNIKNFEILSGDAKIHFLDFEKNKKIFDCVLLDPPRSGCDKEGLLAISKIAKKIIYVSCAPNSLRRDLSILKEEGFEPKFIKAVDLFPFTHHIESVCVFERKNK